MDFRGKKFQFVEYAKGWEGNRGQFAKLSDVEKYVWTKNYKKEELWKSMYSYCDINNLDISFGAYYFESDIEDFEINRKVVLYAVNYLHVQYDIPIEAFKFKFTNRSIWVEVIPSVMGISPSYNLNEIFKEITLHLNKVIYNALGIRNALDTNVYSPRQFSRVVGSFLPKSNRYVIELTYNELCSCSYKQIINMARYPRKVTYPPNNDFYESKEAKELFEHYKQIVQRKNRKRYINYSNSDIHQERLCLLSMEENGVEEGKRNIALFYASIDKRDKGIERKDWEKEIPFFMRNFERRKIDTYAKIKATVKSAYKNKYIFSCKKIREYLPEHCYCEKCPYNKHINKENNVFIIYRKQIEVLIKNKATVQLYKDLFLLQYYNNFQQKEKYLELKKYKELKNIGIITSDGKINPTYTTGSYIEIPVDFIKRIDEFKSEFILYVIMLYSSINNKTLNPKMKTVHYANKIGKSERTIQRYFKILKEQGWIDENKRIILTEKVSDKNKEEILEISFKSNKYERNYPFSYNGKKDIVVPFLSYKKVIKYPYLDKRNKIVECTHKMAIP